MDTDLTDNAFIDAVRETIPKSAPKKSRKSTAKKAAKPKAKKAKRKPAKKAVKATRPKATAKVKRKPAKKVKHSKVKRLKNVKRKATVPERSERLDMRLTKAEKAKVNAKAKKLRRTVTSIVIEAIEKIK